MIFLPVGRNDGIARCGITVHFVLADHRRSSILGNHKTGIQSRIGYQKLRKFAKSHNQLRDTAFGNVSQFCQGNGEKVIGDSQRLTVEISTGNDSVFVREDRWIVRDGIDFGQQYGGNIADSVFRSTMHLRDATERVRILYVRLGTFDQFAACQQFTESLSRLDLSGMRAYLLDAIHKRVDASVEGFKRKSSYQVGFLGKAESFENGKYTVGTHELGTVEQCKPFLAHEPDGFPAKFVEHADCFAFLSFIVDVAHTNQRKEQIG